MIDEIKITKAIASSFMDKFLKGIECDVAIVGAGPSGLTASYYLARSGFKVSIFEKKLSLGGGIWGGGMMFNQVVVQKSALDVLDEFGISYEEFDENHYIVDAIELAGTLIYKAVKAGVSVFNLTTVEDVMIKNGRISGLVINWSAVEMSGLHVDPMTISAKAVVDATGHDAVVCRLVAKKAGRLEIKGERFMHAEEGEKGVVERTSEVFPGLFVTGMAVAAVYGLPRMGPIFGGMLLSGKRVAELISEKLKGKARS